MGPAHCNMSCHAHWRSGIHGMAFQSFCSSSDRLALAALMKSMFLTRVTNMFVPLGLRTSDPSSSILAGHVPLRFQHRVIPACATGPLPSSTTAKPIVCRCHGRGWAKKERKKMTRKAKIVSPSNSSRFTSSSALYSQAEEDGH